MKSFGLIVVFAAALVFSMTATAQDADFTIINHPGAVATDVTGDGTMVSGNLGWAGPNFTWTEAGGVVDIGGYGGTVSISNDGLGISGAYDDMGVSYAGLESNHLLLMQPLARAQAGGEVQMVTDIDLALDDPAGQLAFYIERGHIGASQVAILDSLGSAIGLFEWSGINPDPRNTLIVQLQATELNYRLSRLVMLPYLQTLLFDD